MQVEGSTSHLHIAPTGKVILCISLIYNKCKKFHKIFILKQFGPFVILLNRFDSEALERSEDEDGITSFGLDTTTDQDLDQEPSVWDRSIRQGQYLNYFRFFKPDSVLVSLLHVSGSVRAQPLRLRTSSTIKPLLLILITHNPFNSIYMSVVLSSMMRAIAVHTRSMITVIDLPGRQINDFLERKTFSEKAK